MSKELINALAQPIDKVTQQQLGLAYTEMNPIEQDIFAEYLLEDMYYMFVPKEIPENFINLRCSELEDAIDEILEQDPPSFMEYLMVVVSEYNAENMALAMSQISPKCQISLTRPECYDAFSASPALINTAIRLVSGHQTDTEKAKAIYNYLESFTYNSGENRDGPPLDPTETFETKSGNCNEQTRLFVIMGRAVGLDTGYTSVRVDYSNNPVHHACAWADLDDRITYIDLTYEGVGWDIDHKDTERISDDEVRTTYSSMFQYEKRKHET